MLPCSGVQHNIVSTRAPPEDVLRAQSGGPLMNEAISGRGVSDCTSQHLPSNILSLRQKFFRLWAPPHLIFHCSISRYASSLGCCATATCVLVHELSQM